MPEEKTPALFLHSAIDDYDFTPEEFRIIHRVARRGECTESFLTMETHLHISESMIRKVVKFLVVHNILIKRDKLGSSSTIWVAPFDSWNSKETVDSSRPKQKGRRRPSLPETALSHPVLDGSATGRDGKADTSGSESDGSGWEHDKGNPSKEIPKGNPLKVRPETRARELDTEPFNCSETLRGSVGKPENGSIVKWLSENAPHDILTPGSFAFELVGRRFNDAERPIDEQSYRLWILNCFEDVGPPGDYGNFDLWKREVNTCLKTSRVAGKYCSPKKGNGVGGNGHEKPKYQSPADRQLESIRKLREYEAKKRDQENNIQEHICIESDGAVT